MMVSSSFTWPAWFSGISPGGLHNRCRLAPAKLASWSRGLGWVFDHRHHGQRTSQCNAALAHSMHAAVVVVLALNQARASAPPPPILFYNTMGKPSSERKGIPSTRLSWQKSFPAARLLYLPRPSPTPRANVVRLPFSLSTPYHFTAQYCATTSWELNRSWLFSLRFELSSYTPGPNPRHRLSD